MLKKANRLKSRKLFKQTLDGQRLCANRCFVVYGLKKRPGQSQPVEQPVRFGLIISRKVDKRATRRNQIKRWLREVIRRDLLPQTEAVLGQYRAVVIIVRRGVTEADFTEVQQRLVQCLGRRYAEA